MTRCVAILTVPRSGSSALAGALHAYGLSFGEDGELIGAHQSFNPKGHFEIRKWHDYGIGIARSIDSGLKPGSRDIDGIAAIISKRNKAHPDIWGVKSAWLSHSLPYIWPYMPSDVRLIAIHRRFDAQVRSNVLHLDGGNGTTEDMARYKVLRHRARLYQTLSDFSHLPHYHVQFEALTDDPETVLRQVLAFCYEGIADVDEPMVGRACDWIDASLRHW